MDNKLLIDEVKKNLKDNCLITGGHFRIFFDKKNPEYNINIGTLDSFKYAISLFKIAKKEKIKASIGLLINDMGTLCSDKRCEIKVFSFNKNEFKIPLEYRQILDNENIPEENLIIYWEKHMRNRGKKEIVKRIRERDPLVQKDSEGFYLDDPEGFGKIVLTRKREKDKYGAPACPLIMAGLNLEQDKRFSSSINFYYIGSDNFANIPNHFVIEKGIKVSDYLGADIEVNNIFFNGLDLI